MAEELDLNKYKRVGNNRLDLSKTFSAVPLPNLCDVQLQSFAWFRDLGIDEVFKDIFPIQSNKDSRAHVVDTDQVAELDYVSASWGEPKHDYFSCKVSALTYSAPLHCVLRLKHPDGTVTEEKIFMGDYPWMTPSGTFIVNGSEKCIASQLVRSPGAYVSKKSDEVALKKNDNDIKNELSIVYGSDIIPSRGIWLEFLTDNRDLVSVRIDKQKKVPALVLLRAIGLVSDADSLEDNSLPGEGENQNSSATGVLGLFGNNAFLKKALDKNPVNSKKSATERTREAVAYIFRKLRPGEPFTNESAAIMLKQRFFDNEHYDLGRAGRFKLQNKLGIYNRLVGVTLAEDLISKDGEIVFESGSILSTNDILGLQKQKFFEDNANHTITVRANADLDDHSNVNIVHVHNPANPDEIVNIIGTDLTVNLDYVTISDILASLSYMLNITDGIGNVDDTDHLGNKRVRCVGELIQDKFRAGLSKMKRTIHDRMSTSDLTQLSIASLINIKALTSSVNQFFNSDSLSQFMDQTNPLAELTNKRRLSALGRGGLTRDRASSAVRDVHPTHYGRICPIETPEGQNIGLISNLACYARVNDYGFLETPYRPVHNAIVDNNPEHVCWFSADDEKNHTIAQSNVEVDPNTFVILEDNISARINGEYVTVNKHDVDFIDASPKQIVSIAAACIPFLENDDGKRALMGSNMQRQALPLLHPESPFVGTGLEDKIARDSGEALLSPCNGVITYADSLCIKILDDASGEEKKLELKKFIRSNKRTCINQSPIVKEGDKVTVNQIIADGPSMEKGELALGQNVLIAFTTWHGYNYEDAILISQRCISDDLFTNIIIEEYSCERRKTKLGDEEFTRDVPNVGEDKKTFLDEFGIVMRGTEVKENDILVGKTTPKGETTESNNDHLLKSIFSTKSDEDKDNSLKVPHGGEGIVLDVKRFSRANGDELAADVLESVKVYVVQKRKIQVGDKMSGRHGNKGVISKVLPIEDMPYMPDGTPVDICLSPMGVPSRMNIGQVLEVQLGYACKKLGLKVSTPVFDGASNDEIAQFMDKAGIDADGKTVLFDGQTGERFDSRIAVGVMYMIKLDHMVEDKLHARATGPYSLVTQQPLGGKAQNGGQRFGEMEVWALEAYGAAYTLQEMLTIKSDDMIGRNETYKAITSGSPVPKPNMPESTRVLIKELQGLAIDVRLFDEKNQEININNLSEEAEKANSRIHREMNRDLRQNERDEEDRLRNSGSFNYDDYANEDNEIESVSKEELASENFTDDND